MKNIFKIGLTISIVVLFSTISFADNKDNNITKKSDSNKTDNKLIINLDTLKKKNGLRGIKSKVINGVITISKGNDEVSYSLGDSGNNDEVINIGKAKVCLVGTKKSLLWGDFKLTILNEGEDIASYPKIYKNREMCISLSDIRKGDTIVIKDRFKKDKVNIKIKR